MQTISVASWSVLKFLEDIYHRIHKTRVHSLFHREIDDPLAEYKCQEWTHGCQNVRRILMYLVVVLIDSYPSHISVRTTDSGCLR